MEILKTSDSEKLKPVFELAIKDLKNMFEMHLDPTDRDKVATSVIGAYTRMRATEIHSDVLKYQIIKEITTDQKELIKYVKIGIPEIAQTFKNKGAGGGA